MSCKYKHITKRDGTETPFDKIKITNALYYTFKDVNGKASRKSVKPITDKVIVALNENEANTISVEDVQDTVESVLMKEGFHKEAKAYILYRESAKCQREKHYLHAEKLVSDYMEQSDWRVKENANAGYSYPSLVNHISSSVLASYALYKMYPKHIADAHINGDLHLHDLGCSVVHYCCGWSLKDLLMRGFTGVSGRASAKPAKHFDTALLQIVNFLMTQQTEAAGAQAINSFDTLLAPYVRKDNLTYSQIKQCIQQMIFGLNVAARLGQAAFTNVSLDWSIPYDLYNEPIIHAGEYILEETYSDYQHEMDLINKAFLEVMIEGDSDGKIFSFPIPTYNVTKDFNWDSENADLLFEMTAKYGIPYFQNFVNSELDPRDVRSLCCRLSLNVKELKTKTGGLFGAGDSTGSIGVVTLNLARLGYLAKDEDDLFKRLDSLMDIAKDSLEIKRDYITTNFNNGLMPYTALAISGFQNHFSTIGIVGGNEMCLNFMGKTLIEEEAIDLMKRVMLHMRERILSYQEETGNLYNLEASPAEACLDINTPIQTVIGSMTIKEIMDYCEENNCKIPVFSYNEKTRKIEIKDAHAFLSNKGSKVMRITFDKGDSVVCTYGHPFGKRLIDENHNCKVVWVEAQDLKVGDRIKSNYLFKKKNENGEAYLQTSDHTRVHRLVAEYKIGRPLEDGEVVHHKDHNKLNNSPENLEILSEKEHKALHIIEMQKLYPEKFTGQCGEKNPFYGKHHTDETKKMIHDKKVGRFIGDDNPARRADVREKLSIAAKNKDFTQHSQYRKDIDESKIVELYKQGYNPNKIARTLGGAYTNSIVRSRLKRLGLLELNHVVVKIEYLDDVQDVYNLEVEDNHNFFVGKDDAVLTHNTSFRLARIDIKKYPDIIQASTETPYYTNSTQLPVGYTNDIYEYLDLQEGLQCLYTGGSVVHIYIGEEITKEQAKYLVKNVCSKYRVPYISITPTFSICPEHGYIPGEHHTCPKCS